MALFCLKTSVGDWENRGNKSLDHCKRMFISKYSFTAFETAGFVFNLL